MGLIENITIYPKTEDDYDLNGFDGNASISTFLVKDQNNETITDGFILPTFYSEGEYVRRGLERPVQDEDYQTGTDISVGIFSGSPDSIMFLYRDTINQNWYTTKISGTYNNVQLTSANSIQMVLFYENQTLITFEVDIEQPAEDPPVQDPPEEDPPAEDPPVQDPPVQNICFTAGSIVSTDQGKIQIEKIDSKINTINKQEILHVIVSINTDNYLICIQKNAFGKNYPNKDTYMSGNHKLLYKSSMVKSRNLLFHEGVSKIKYNGEKLYNVLLKSYSKMIVNNLKCETLHPNHILGLLYSNMNIWNNNDINHIVSKLNRCVSLQNENEYKRIINYCQNMVIKKKLPLNNY